MKYQTKYFDINTKAKRTNAWERSLLELRNALNGTGKIHDTYSKESKKKTRTGRTA